MARTTESDPAWRWVLARYLAAAVPARIADEGARVSLVLLALDVSGSAALGGAMIAALLVPHVVAAPLAGLVIDRARRPRWVLAAAVLVFAGALFSVALLLGQAPNWLVFVLLLLGGCVGPAITGGLTGQLPALVGLDHAPRAFGFDSLFYNVASVVGPALAGITAAAVSPRAAQLLLAGSAVLGAVCIAALPIVARSQPVGTRRPSLLSGAREILREPTLRVITLTSTLGQLGPGALAVVAAVLAIAMHQPASSGLLLAAVAAGSFLGSLLWTWRPIAADRSPLVVAVSMIGIGVPIALAAASPSIEVTAVLFGLSGTFIGPFGSALFTARTLYSAEAARTQVFTIGAGLKVTASALGAGLIGLVADIPIPAQLLLVASSPLLSGVLGTALLTLGTAHQGLRTPDLEQASSVAD
jgi:predicted MFS family arabinose efflux permease